MRVLLVAEASENDIPARECNAIRGMIDMVFTLNHAQEKMNTKAFNLQVGHLHNFGIQTQIGQKVPTKSN